MNPRVRFDDDADAEYRLAGRWYEARRETSASSSSTLLTQLLTKSWRCPAPAPGSADCQKIYLIVRRRAVTRFPYHVVYLELATHIRILAIAHDRRKPGYWKDGLK